MEIAGQPQKITALTRVRDMLAIPLAGMATFFLCSVAIGDGAAAFSAHLSGGAYGQACCEETAAGVL